jgi:hypothetical protein
MSMYDHMKILPAHYGPQVRLCCAARSLAIADVDLGVVDTCNGKRQMSSWISLDLAMAMTINAI